MKQTFLTLAAVSLAVGAFAIDSPEDPCTDAMLRVVDSFDLSTAAEREADPLLTKQDRAAGETVGYMNQMCFERMLGDKNRETYLRQTYFNGTAEAKAYALLGLSFTKSPLYATLKADFLRYQDKVVVRSRVHGLKTAETPAGIIAAIDSGKLSVTVTPREHY